MNEQIKLLVEQAKKSIPPGLDTEEWLEVYHTKFAKLIVQECMNLCEQIAIDAHEQKDSGFLTADGRQLYNGVWGGAMNCIGKIKNHFGVE